VVQFQYKKGDRVMAPIYDHRERQDVEQECEVIEANVPKERLVLKDQNPACDYLRVRFTGDTCRTLLASSVAPAAPPIPVIKSMSAKKLPAPAKQGQRNLTSGLIAGKTPRPTDPRLEGLEEVVGELDQYVSRDIMLPSDLLLEQTERHALCGTNSDDTSWNKGLNA